MRLALLLGLAVATLGTIPSVIAAEPEERLRQGVVDRDRPSYAAKGMRAGSFLLYPALNLSIAHDDNIFATDGNEEGDFIFNVHPEIALESNFPRHAAYFRGEAQHLTYFDNGSEDRTNYFLGGGTRFDLRKTLHWNTDLEYQKNTEDRGSADALGAAIDPVDFNRFLGKSQLRYRPGRTNFTSGGIYENFDFEDVGLFGGGTQNNDDRDRNVYGGFGRVGYEVQPGYEAFVLGLYSVTNYRSAFDDNGFDRDSKGYQIEAGVRAEITNVMAGELSLGYLDRNYDDARLGDVQGFATEGDIEWYVSRLTTLTFGASRRVQETTLLGASGYLETAVNVGVDHELLRNVILSAYGLYNTRSYEGISRDDDEWQVTGRALYMLNRNFSVAGEFVHRDRESTALGEDFKRNIGMLTFRAQL